MHAYSLTSAEAVVVRVQVDIILQTRAWFKTHEAAGHQPPTLARAASRYYKQRMKQCGAVDFDDMLFLTERLFAENAEVLRIARRLHTHVLVE
jgi:superfamily I DNA/RNA helicase